MRIGVIGLGFMGTTHLKAWRSVPGAEIVAVCSEEESRLSGDLSAVQGNIGGPGEKFDFSKMGRYTKPEDLLAQTDVEAVDICLPTHLHGAVAIAALKAGKHVLVEKPMALTGEETDQMLAEAARSGKILMSGQVLRFLPTYRATADALKSGKYGTVRSALFRRRCSAPFWSQWLGDASRSGGGVFDLLIHDIDYALHVFGKPETISATGYEDMGNGVDTLTGTMLYPDGLSVVVTGGWHHRKAYPFSMEYTIVADGGTFEFNTNVSEAGVTVYGADGEARSLELPEQDGFEAELRYFHECASAGRHPAMCPPEESAAAVKLAIQLVNARNNQGACQAAHA